MRWWRREKLPNKPTRAMTPTRELAAGDKVKFDYNWFFTPDSGQISRLEREEVTRAMYMVNHSNGAPTVPKNVVTTFFLGLGRSKLAKEYLPLFALAWLLMEWDSSVSGVVAIGCNSGDCSRRSSMRTVKSDQIVPSTASSPWANEAIKITGWNNGCPSKINCRKQW